MAPKIHQGPTHTSLARGINGVVVTNHVFFERMDVSKKTLCCSLSRIISTIKKNDQTHC